MSEPSKTITLSDGNEWRLELRRKSAVAMMEQHWLSADTDGVKHDSPIPYLSTGRSLTAADHRKIADVLDPPTTEAQTVCPMCQQEIPNA